MKSRATQTKELDMVNGPLARKILIYSIPLMFSNLLQVFFNMTDVAVVGKFAGARALGSVGSTTIIITLTTGILLGMGGGVNAVTALHMGAEDYRRVHKTCPHIGHSVLYSGTFTVSGRSGFFKATA